jgi:hypothetical protein
MKTTFLMIISSVLFFACTKDNTNTKITIVRGEVRNKLTNELLPNIPLEIRGCDVNGKCLTTVARTSTNTNGTYELSFEKKAGLGRHLINIGRNDIIPGNFETYIDLYKLNTINFSEKPYKTLLLKVQVNRHDKNWLNIGLTNGDNEGFWSSDFYFGANPTTNLSASYYTKIQAGRYYTAYVGLSNKIADYNYQDNEFVYKNFYVDNVDTTSVSFIVQ